jgi:Arginase family
VGVPSSAASYAAGQDLAPAALRSAGLLGQLIASGLQVHDDGDLPHQAWSPDRDHPLAQNAGRAAASVRQLADRLHPLLARGDIALVLGGNCTIALGVVAALRRLGAGARGLLYVDRHYPRPGRRGARAAARDQRMRALSIGELNPTRCAGDPAALARFVTSITRILAATIH